MGKIIHRMAHTFERTFVTKTTSLKGGGTYGIFSEKFVVLGAVVFEDVVLISGDDAVRRSQLLVAQPVATPIRRRFAA